MTAPKKVVPDFFVVGHPKCGTTAIYEMLRSHPEIFMPDMKEPWFFATELLHESSGISAGLPNGMPRTLAEYLALFEAAEPNQLVGEASALYLWSRFAARGIAELQPAARIIAVFREPASFLRSLHLELVQQHQEPESDLRKAIFAEDERRQGDYVPPSTWYWPIVTLYSDYVRYAEQLQRYREVFPPEQILVLIYDDFRRDNETAMRTIQRFLGVNDTNPINAVNANPTVRVRSMYLNDLLGAVLVGAGPFSGTLKTTIRRLTSERLRNRALEATQRRVIYSKPEPPDDQLMLELRLRYRHEVLALSESIDRDLVSLWDYEDIV